MADFRLCYVDGAWAYFTTQPLDKQWGDDWNDAPYEYNAGTPYEYGEHDRKQGRDPWELCKCAFDGYWDTPETEHFNNPYSHFNSPYSVEAINGGAIAWLRQTHRGININIPAGTTLDEFIRLIELGGGRVYLPREAGNAA